MPNRHNRQMGIPGSTEMALTILPWPLAPTRMAHAASHSMQLVSADSIGLPNHLA